MAGRNATSILKEFYLSDNLEDPDQIKQGLRWLDHFCDEVALNTPALRKGTYSGNGLIHVVSIPDAPGPPVLMILQDQQGGTPFLTLLPTGAITAWSQPNFTLAASGLFNLPGHTYLFLVVA